MRLDYPYILVTLWTPKLISNIQTQYTQLQSLKGISDGGILSSKDNFSNCCLPILDPGFLISSIYF